MSSELGQQESFSTCSDDQTTKILHNIMSFDTEPPPAVGELKLLSA